jgi:hypothetical protein
MGTLLWFSVTWFHTILVFVARAPGGSTRAGAYLCLASGLEREADRIRLLLVADDAAGDETSDAPTMQLTPNTGCFTCVDHRGVSDYRSKAVE